MMDEIVILTLRLGIVSLIAYMLYRMICGDD